MKHKSIDYKLIAVKYYLKNDISMDKLCDIFECKKSTFRDWVNKYKNTNNLSRNNRNSISYKITNEQVKYAIQLLKQNQQITMFELAKLITKGNLR